LNAARLGADAVALRHGSETLTWAELDRRSTRRAWALKAAGVVKDDLVTIALRNGAAFYELTFALWKIGATPHVVSWRLPRLELQAILEVARPRLIVASEPEFIRAFGALDPTVTLSDARDDPVPGAVATYWKAMSSGGSTGRPKIIIDHMPGMIDPELPVILIPRDERILNPGPIYHNGPFSQTHRALFRGNTVVGMLKFDPEETLRLIAEHRITWINMVPTMMLRIWRLPKEVRLRYTLDSLQHVWHMAAPMPPWLKEAWIEWLGAERIFEFYGGTEMQGATVISGPEWLAHKGSVGRPVLCEIRILDEHGNACQPGEIGEIFMLPAVERGTPYHYLGAEPRRAGDGFESIGDFGWLDADGYLYLADRRTDMILVGGANVYPAEVEAALMQHPAVEVAVVIGLPDEDMGSRVHAIVKPHPEVAKTITAEALSEFVQERLARYKTPRSYEFTMHTLRDDAGKVRRTGLRDDRVRGHFSGQVCGAGEHDPMSGAASASMDAGGQETGR
jgi:bile acid-coenzyme A ligase